MRDRGDRSHQEVRYLSYLSCLVWQRNGRETQNTWGSHFICFKIHVATNYFTHVNVQFWLL